MVDLTTNFDWSLARRHPRLTAVPRPDGMLPMAVAGDIEAGDWTIIPDWPLHWVHAVWNLYRYVGDRDEIAALLGVVEGVVRWFVPFCDEDGLPTDVYGWVIIDWSAIYNEGVSAALCGLWGRALLEFAEMAAWLGDKGRAEVGKGNPRAISQGRLRTAVGQEAQALHRLARARRARAPSRRSTARQRRSWAVSHRNAASPPRRGHHRSVQLRARGIQCRRARRSVRRTGRGPGSRRW